MKKMAADSVTKRWWQETDPCQLPLPEAAAQLLKSSISIITGIVVEDFNYL